MAEMNNLYVTKGPYVDKLRRKMIEDQHEAEHLSKWTLSSVLIYTFHTMSLLTITGWQIIYCTQWTFQNDLYICNLAHPPSLVSQNLPAHETIAKFGIEIMGHALSWTESWKQANIEVT